MMLEGEEVRDFFRKYPEAAQRLQETEAQCKLWRPEYTHEDMYRKLTLEDVIYITSDGPEGEPGRFAWVYPLGIPYVVQIMGPEEADALEVDSSAPETVGEMILDAIDRSALAFRRAGLLIPFNASPETRERMEGVYYTFDCMDPFLSAGAFRLEVLGTSEADLIEKAADHEADLIKWTYTRGEVPKREIIYTP